MEVADRETLERAIALRTQGEHAQARTLLVELAARCPEGLVQYHAAWVHDAMGLEEAAIPFYRRAIESGELDGPDLEGAMIGLGSTYRCLGRYSEAVQLLEPAVRMFPDSRALQVFLAMVYHNLGRHDESAEILLRNLAETTNDGGILKYRRAILHYAPCLREVWDQG